MLRILVELWDCSNCNCSFIVLRKILQLWAWSSQVKEGGFQCLNILQKLIYQQSNLGNFKANNKNHSPPSFFLPSFTPSPSLIIAISSLNFYYFRSMSSCRLACSFFKDQFCSLSSLSSLLIRLLSHISLSSSFPSTSRQRLNKGSPSASSQRLQMKFSDKAEARGVCLRISVGVLTVSMGQALRLICTTPPFFLASPERRQSSMVNLGFLESMRNWEVAFSRVSPFLKDWSRQWVKYLWFFLTRIWSWTGSLTFKLTLSTLRTTLNITQQKQIIPRVLPTATRYYSNCDNQGSMSASSYLMRFGKSVLSWSNRAVKFVRHRMMTQKKNILIIGHHRTPLYAKLYPLIANNWEITHLEDSPHGQTPAAQSYPPGKEGTGEQSKEVSLKKESFFKRLYLRGDNYQEIQRQLQGKQFDSIVVLPEIDTPATSLNADNESFAVDYPLVHQQQLMRNLFAYRLASKCLTSAGVIILSASELDFLKEEGRQASGWLSSEMMDAQVSYLGVVVGDRDHTDLNSWSLVALSKEISLEDPDFVALRYKLWADSQQLPMPGTFALFRRKTADSKAHFIQYL